MIQCITGKRYQDTLWPNLPTGNKKMTPNIPIIVKKKIKCNVVQETQVTDNIVQVTNNDDDNN